MVLISGQRTAPLWWNARQAREPSATSCDATGSSPSTEQKDPLEDVGSSFEDHPSSFRRLLRFKNQIFSEEQKTVTMIAVSTQ